MKKALVFDAERTAYNMEAVQRPITVRDLRAFLEDYDDDTPVLLRHDGGYSFGTISEERSAYYEENESGELEETSCLCRW